MAAKHDTIAHRATRRHLAPTVAAGLAVCTEPVCLMPTRRIEPGTAWDLAHAPGDLGYRGPAHAKCNRSEGAARGNRTRKKAGPRRWAL